MTALLTFLLLALGGYTLWLHRKASVLAEDLRYVHKSWRAAIEAQSRSVSELREEVAELRRAAPATDGGGGSWFTRYMTIQDALNVHPGVADVMKSLHIGGCTSCSVSSKETLEQAAAGHGVDLAVMLSKLNALMASAPAAEQVPASSPLVFATGPVPPR
ncbi:DUF1858 domain-containing protein [bacterium]|nr:DUF1858 domain-containing protein [bacterium]